MKPMKHLKTLLLALAGGCLISGIAWGQDIRTVAAYVVTPVAHGPTLDGDLSDAAWTNAPASHLYYEYYKPNPGPGALKTALRMVYDPHGLYVGIVNYDNNTANLRRHVVARDDPKLWTDDCAELYFDPAASGVAYHKFTINALGTQGDMLKTDLGVSNNNWSGYGWRVATKVYKDHWTIEAFFPWADLGRKAEPGQTWMFNHTRYAWSSGKFVGVTWAAGGNYNATDKFGYLCFVGESGSDMKQIVQRLAERITPPWRMVASGGIYVCRQKGQTHFFKPDELVRSAARETELATKRAAEAIAKSPDSKASSTLDKLRQAEQKVNRENLSPSQALDAAGRLNALRGQMDDLYWKARLRGVLEGAK